MEYIKLDNSQLVKPNASTYIRTSEQKSRDAVQTFISIDNVSNKIIWFYVLHWCKHAEIPMCA